MGALERAKKSVSRCRVTKKLDRGKNPNKHVIRSRYQEKEEDLVVHWAHLKYGTEVRVQ